jgi:steroid delta-isomerase-like uncharacterized protein
MTDWDKVEETNMRAVTDVLTPWNRHDVNGVLEYYDDGIIWTNIALEEQYHGKQEVGGFIRQLITAFPDLHFTVSERLPHEQFLAEKWEIHGTHLGPFLNIPATGRPIVIPGMSMVELKDGKFYRDSFYFDSTGVLRQMGLMPPLSVTQTLPGRALLWAAVNRLPVATLAAFLAIVAFFVRHSRHN